MSRKFCAEPGCSQFAIKGYARCAQHQAKRWKRFDQDRPTSTRRGYDRDWRHVTIEFLQEHPICQVCGERQATLTHHKVPIRSGGKRLDKKNLMAVCNHCHGELHAEMMQQGGAPL